MDQELHTPETDEQRRRRRRPLLIGGALVGVVVVAVLAFGVFGVQTLFIDDTVEEAGPVFDSGASAAAGAPITAAPVADADEVDAAGDEPSSAPVAEEVTTTTAPQVAEAARGSFEARDHPGEGTAVVLTDGQQTFVRFEDDFSTDNGPDLFVLVVADGETIELGRLKGNQGSQNYELPSSVDPATVTEVSVWCKRFDSTFTVAALG